MKIFHATRDLKPRSQPVCLAMGFFDGVHLGHQQIIRQTLADARQHQALALVLTFDRHPNVVVAPDRVPPLIYSLSQKLETLDALGVDAVLLLHFDLALSRQSGETFVRRLVHDLDPLHSVCVGRNFLFGHERRGNVASLKHWGDRWGFHVHAIPGVSLEGRVVSSTRIRQTIQTGDLATASRLLGRPYALRGEVVRGDGMGRKLGFPTCNLDTTGRVLPPSGVYVAQANMRGRSHRALLNLGVRPTVNPAASQRRVEVHLLDEQGDFYGEELEVIFGPKLRDEQRFPSLAALQRQIARDIAQARKRG